PAVHRSIVAAPAARTREVGLGQRGAVTSVRAARRCGPVAWAVVTSASPEPGGSVPAGSSPGDRPLRIAIVSDCYVPRLGGIEMQAHDLARNLVAAGHEVVAITPTAGPNVVDGV